MSNRIACQLAEASKLAIKYDIIELDEIYTFVKKKGPEQLYGLLILGKQAVLLRMS